MKVIIKGEARLPDQIHKQDRERKIIEYNLLDRYDATTKTSSIARTTGYTCTASVNLIAKELFAKKGVFPPELVGKEKKCFDFVMKYLDQRNVSWKKVNREYKNNITE